MDLVHLLPTSAILLSLYYYYFVSRKPKIYGTNKLQLEFVRNIRVLDEKYYPTFYYLNGIAQTIYGLLKRWKTRLDYEREIFKLADGGEIALDFKHVKGRETGKGTLVIILPGLTSASQTSYVKTLVMACGEAGASVVVMNNRGLGGMPLKTCRSFCASNCSDLEEVMRHLKGRFPEKRIVAVGTSLGGIVLSQYLIKCPKEATRTLECAILISIVWNAHTATASIERPVTKYFINSALAESLKAFVVKHRTMLESRWDVEDIVKRSHTLRQFDTNFTAPQFGYFTCKDYYDDVTVSTKIHQFPIPVFGLSAADDPMQPGPTLPTREASLPGSNLVLIVTSRGGHLGFLEGMFPGMRKFHFMERFVRDFVVNFQNNHSLKKCVL